MHFGSALGLAEAIKLQLEIGVNKIWEHNLALREYLLEILPSEVQSISPNGDADKSAIVALKLPLGHEAAEVAEKLQNEHHIVVTNRGPFLRVSLHYYNGTSDLDAFVDALKKVLHL